MKAHEGPHLARVGVFLAASVALLFAAIILLGRSQTLFAHRVRLQTAFENTSGLVVGAPVRLAGVDVGIVEAIRFDKDLRHKNVHVTLVVDRRYLDRIRDDSVARLSSKGLLGDMIINISVGSAEAAPLKDGGSLRSQESEGLTEILESVQDGIGEVRALTETVRGRIGLVVTDELARDIGRIAHATAGVVENVESGRGLAHTLVYDPKIPRQAERFFADASDTAARANDALGRVDRLLGEIEHGEGSLHGLVYRDDAGKLLANVDRTVDELDAMIVQVREGKGLLHSLVYDQERTNLLDNLTALSATLKRMAGEVDRGKGTVGALIKDPSVYEDLKVILGNVKRNKLLRAIIRYEIQKDGLKATECSAARRHQAGDGAGEPEAELALEPLDEAAQPAARAGGVGDAMRVRQLPLDPARRRRRHRRLARVDEHLEVGERVGVEVEAADEQPAVVEDAELGVQDGAVELPDLDAGAQQARVHQRRRGAGQRHVADAGHQQRHAHAAPRRRGDRAEKAAVGQEVAVREEDAPVRRAERLQVASPEAPPAADVGEQHVHAVVVLAVWLVAQPMRQLGARGAVDLDGDVDPRLVADEVVDEVDAADEGDAIVDDQELAMIAPPLPVEDAAPQRVVDGGVAAGDAQRGDDAGGDVAGAPGVDDDAHLDPALRRLLERGDEQRAHARGGDGVDLEVDRRGRRADGREHAGEGDRAAIEQHDRARRSGRDHHRLVTACSSAVPSRRRCEHSASRPRTTRRPRSGPWVSVTTVRCRS